MRDKRDHTIPRKWRYRQWWPVEREGGGIGERGLRIWGGRAKSKPYAGWISSIVPNSNQLAALGLSIKINIFSMATSYTGLLIIKRAFVHPAASHWLDHSTTHLEVYRCRKWNKCVHVWGALTLFCHMQHCILLLEYFRHLEKTCLCCTLVCLFHNDLASFIAVQPELTGSRSKHSETITSGSLKMNHTFVLLCTGFIAAIKVFFNLQTTVNTSKASFSWICLCEGLCSVWMPSNLLPVKSVLQTRITELSVELLICRISTDS